MWLAAGKSIVIFHFQAEVPPAVVEGDSNFHAEVVSSDELKKIKRIYICNDFQSNWFF